jgi:hypothetical protein
MGTEGEVLTLSERQTPEVPRGRPLTQRETLALRMRMRGG